MEKLMKYLDKHGIEYQKTTYGKNYFFNAAPVQFVGLLIAWDFDDRETVMKWEKEMKLIEKYAARYGYSVGDRGGCLGSAWISVWKTSDAQEYREYRMFSDECADMWEVMQHRYYRGDFPAWDDAFFEKASRLLMDKYGRDYNAYKARKTA